jgi:hypothetical protein
MGEQNATMRSWVSGGSSARSSKVASASSHRRKRPPPVEPRPGAWPEEQFKALRPGEGRAVVQATDVDGHRHWARRLVNSFEWIVRLRLPDGEYGPRERRWVFVSDEVAAQIERGDEIPVTLDPVSGALDVVDVDRLRDERKVS